MNINLYINDKLTATATDLSAAEVREEAELMCDELNNVDGPLTVFRVDYVDAENPLNRTAVVLEDNGHGKRQYKISTWEAQTL